MARRHTLQEQFERYATPEPNSGCWLWSGPTWKGYGVICGEGKKLLAHRYSFSAHKSIAQKHMDVCHSCDTPACVNPAHLFLGTAKDNMSDAAAKGRLKVPRLLGEENGSAKLSNETVRNIKSKLAAKSNRVLAAEFKTSASTISRIRLGLSWGHL